MILLDLIDAAGGWIFFGVILLVVIGIVVLAALFTGLAIRYTVRRLRQYFCHERVGNHAHG